MHLRIIATRAQPVLSINSILIRKYGYDIQFTEENVDLLMIATIQAAQGVLDYLIQFFTDEIVEPDQKQDLGKIL